MLGDCPHTAAFDDTKDEELLQNALMNLLG